MPADSATNRNQIEVEFEVVDPAPSTARDGVEGSGIDFSASEVQLMAPDNSPIDGEKTYDGISRITFGIRRIFECGDVHPRRNAGGCSGKQRDFRRHLQSHTTWKNR